ncbi:MAG: exodeoxyribonuclease III [Promethearchaeota archaeon]
MKIISWNVNGFRAVVQKGFYKWFNSENPDILCLQETKAQIKQLPAFILDRPEYRVDWYSAQRKGYSGVGTFSRIEPISVSRGFGIKKFDTEGRLLISEFKEFILINCYFPNGKKDDNRLKYKLDFYDTCFDFMEKLRKQDKKIILLGDLNTAHNEIDLANPKANSKYSGFLRIERDWMDKLTESGYIDTYRHLNPDETGAYTWWSMRAREARQKNVGWRLDYVYITVGLLENLKNAFISRNVSGSDHCPVGIELEF